MHAPAAQDNPDDGATIGSGPLILAVETSGRTGSVAVAAGPQILARTTFSGPMRHSAELFPAAATLLEQLGRTPGQVEHIYISVGPGSFTGLRIAVTMAKTMHLANKAVKIVAVDTLDIIAANATGYIKNSPTVEKPPKRACPDRIAAILDAKRGQFFVAGYEEAQPPMREPDPADHESALQGWQKTCPDCLMTVEQFVDRFADVSRPTGLLGEGLVYYKDKFETAGVEFFDESLWTPKAEKVHQLAWQMAQKDQFADPMKLTPAYLRQLDVKVKS